jgi:hypothetical protein
MSGAAQVRLCHGTDMNSAMDIRDNGLDEQRALATGQGNAAEFHATTDVLDANFYAGNSGVQRGAAAARLEFTLGSDIIQDLLSRGLAFHIDGGTRYVFYAGSFGVLNASMMNKTVVSVP